jgi:anthranilate synthase component 1
MKKTIIKTKSRTLIADILTPVSVYLKLRDKFANPILLESSDFNGDENSYSIVCFNPIASFKVSNGMISKVWPNGVDEEYAIDSSHSVPDQLQSFINSFEIDSSEAPFRLDGFFGYSAYDSVQYFETVKLQKPTKEENKIPELQYGFYKYVIVFNHFKSELYIIENLLDGEESTIDTIEYILKGNVVSEHSFQTKEGETSNLTDDEFIEMVKKGKQSCFRGDVFQIVLSRQFSQQFMGDEFCVYRALRSINPSPYLFYFDYGNFRIFGSSPEAQLIIRDGRAIINPIAGTFKRTGDDLKDAESAIALTNDPKENAEHVMLVDLARNDLSRNGEDVTVDKYREVQYFSHVIHLVSKVSGKLQAGANPMRVMADTFPAGTLSGAPKFRAMELISQYEKQGRGYYGGCIGYIDLNGNLNQAIMIRTFLSKNNTLFYQAGAGIVAKSVEESELQEVNNKLAALKKAIQLAEKF